MVVHSLPFIFQTLRREEVFVTSKLWNTKHDPEDVEEACRTSLAHLGLSYVDLYLMHWPIAFQWAAAQNNLILSACGCQCEDQCEISWSIIIFVIWSSLCVCGGFRRGKELMPRREDGSICYSDTHYRHTWAAMESLVDKGLVKAIGLSNFNVRQTDDIISVARYKPVVNQVQHGFLVDQNKCIQ